MPKIKDVIETLQSEYDPDDMVVYAIWDAEAVARAIVNYCTAEEKQRYLNLQTSGVPMTERILARFDIDTAVEFGEDLLIEELAKSASRVIERHINEP